MGNCPVRNRLENSRNSIVSCVGSAGSSTFRKVYDKVKTRCHQPDGVGIQDGVQLSSHCANLGLSLQEGAQIVAQKWWQG